MSKLVKGDRVHLNSAYKLCVKNKIDQEEEEKKETATDYQNLKKSANAVIEKANRYAAEVYKQAQEKAEKVLKDSYDEGFAKGYEEGRTKADAEARETLGRITALLEYIDSKKNEMIEGNKRNIIKLAIQIAQKIVEKELTQDDKTFINIFKKAVEEIHGQKRVKLTVSGYEAEFATMSSDYLLSMVKDAEQIDISVLSDAPRGTCIVETESEIVDASVSKQLDAIEEVLTN